MNELQQLLQLIQQGNLDLETGLQALIKQEMDNGQTVEVALQALIKQAKDLDSNPAIEALIRLQQLSSDKLIEKLSENQEGIAQLGSEISKTLSPINKLVETLVTELKKEKPVTLTESERESIVIDAARKATPIKGKDYNDGEKGDRGDAGDAGEDAEITEDHLKEVAEMVKPLIPTVEEIASHIETPAPEVTEITKKITETVENKVTKAQIRAVIAEDVKSGKLLTQTAVAKLIKSLKGQNKIEIKDVKDLDKYIQYIKFGDGGGRGEAHPFTELPDTPDELIDGMWFKVENGEIVLTNAPPALSIVEVTAAYSVLLANNLINCTANSFTVTLPSAATVGEGVQFIIKNSGTGVITIACDGSETIDGETTQVLSIQYESVTLVSDGTNWLVI